MKENIIVITTDNELSIRPTTENTMLDDLQKIVGGRIETVRCLRLGPPYLLICNEEGLMMDLPYNPVASNLYGEDMHGNPIVGDISIVKDGYRDGEPDIVGLTEDEAKELFRKLGGKYSVLKWEV